MSDINATTEDSREIEKRSRMSEIAVSREAGVEIKNMADAWTLAIAYTRAGLVPQGDTPETTMMKILAGAEVGLGANASLKHLMVVNKTASLWGDGPMALCLRSGKVENVQSGFIGKPFDDDYTAWFEIKRKGVETPVRREFSVGDAKLAGLWGKTGPWKTYPKRMLFNRARAFALRDLFPDVLGGLGIAEELEGIGGPSEQHESRSDAMLAALHEAKHATPNEVEDEPEDVPFNVDEPTPEEVEEIRRAEMKEAGLFQEGEDG